MQQTHGKRERRLCSISLFFFLFSFVQMFPAPAAGGWEGGFGSLDGADATRRSRAALLVWDGVSIEDFTANNPGDGSDGAPYEIATPAQLAWLAAQVNGGTDYNRKSFRLVADIDLGGKLWTPIGGTGAGFRGRFDGGGHVVRNLFVSADQGVEGVGLFGLLASDSIEGSVSNLSLVNVDVWGTKNVGALAGEAGTGFAIRSCDAAGRVSGTEQVGGLVGELLAGVSNSGAAVDVSGDGGSIGGLVGRVAANINVTACYATGDVSGGSGVGGLVGTLESDSATLQNCYATGDVTGTGQNVGGFVGYNEGNILECYATGHVDGGESVGGFVGYYDKNTWVGISECYAIGDVDGDKSVGGFVGFANSGDITACYATGDVGGTGDSVGGFAGQVSADRVAASYARGRVSGTASPMGGFIGYNRADGVVQNCYSYRGDAGFLIDTVGASEPGAVNDVVSLDVGDFAYRSSGSLASSLNTGASPARWGYTTLDDGAKPVLRAFFDTGAIGVGDKFVTLSRDMIGLAPATLAIRSNDRVLVRILPGGYEVAAGQWYSDMPSLWHVYFAQDVASPDRIIVRADGYLSDASLDVNMQFRISGDRSSDNYQMKSFRLVLVDDLEIATTALPPGVQGQTYTASLDLVGAAGGVAAIHGIFAPANGETLSCSDGSISFDAAPNVTSYVLTLTVSDDEGQTATRRFKIPMRPPLGISNGSQIDNGYLVIGGSGGINVTPDGGDGNYTFGLEGAPPYISIDQTGAIVLVGTPTPGDAAVTVVVTDGSGQRVATDYTLHVVNRLTVSSDLPPDGTVGDAYAFTVFATGGVAPYTFRSSGQWPDGLQLHPSGNSAAIAGTPTTEGSFDLTVNVSDDSGQSASKRFRISVYDRVRIATGAALPDAMVGRSYADRAVSIGATGGKGPLSYIVTGGTLPEGLSLDAATGRITGTPLTSGDYGFTVKACDGHGRSADRTFALPVLEALVILPQELPRPTSGEPYAARLEVRGGRGSYTIGSGGSLPAGLQFDPAALTIAGTPTGDGVFTFVVSADDASGYGVEKTYRTAFFGALYFTTPPQLPDAAVGQPYAQRIAADGGEGSLSYALTDGALPDGLGLAADGRIAGTPLAAGTFQFTVTAADPYQSASQDFVLTVLSDDGRNPQRSIADLLSDLNARLSGLQVGSITVPPEIGTAVATVRSNDALFTPKARPDATASGVVHLSESFYASLSLANANGGDALGLSLAIPLSGQSGFETWGGLEPEERLALLSDREARVVHEYEKDTADTPDTATLVGADGLLTWAQAHERGIVGTTASGLTFHYVVKDAAGGPYASGALIIVPDGAQDNRIVDPLWLLAAERETAPPAGGVGGGGCDAGTAACALLLAAAVSLLRKRR